MTSHGGTRHAPLRILGDPRQQPEAFHPCCVDDCDQQTLIGYIACRRHWLSLAPRTRWLLRQVFRRRETEPEAYRKAVAVGVMLIRQAAAGGS